MPKNKRCVVFCVSTFVGVECEGSEVSACCACGWDFPEAEERDSLRETTDDCGS